MRQQEPRGAQRALAVAAALLGACIALPAWGVDAGCAVARLSAPVILPDGTQHPAGAFELCVSRDLSPVTAVHRLSLDGMPIAYAFSRVGWSEVEAPLEPFVLFHRTANGSLRLIGYAWPEGAAARTYLLAGDRPDWRALSRATRRDGTPVVEDTAIIVAALRRR